MGFVRRARAEDSPGVLVLEVFSGKVPSDVVQEKSFAQWAEVLKGGSESSREHAPVIHAVYRLTGVLNIDKQYTTGEGSEEQIAVAGSAEPAGNGGAYTVRFSELGRPPAYGGKTALTIRPQERQILVLPADELDAGDKLETEVSLEYKVETKKNELKSDFEI